jgi:hypothetical protein
VLPDHCVVVTGKLCSRVDIQVGVLARCGVVSGIDACFIFGESWVGLYLDRVDGGVLQQAGESLYRCHCGGADISNSINMGDL